MKVLVACTDFIPDNLGRQPWYYMNSIVNELRSNGHDVWIMTNRTYESRDSDNVIGINKFRSFPMGVSPSAVRAVNLESFDVIFWSLGLTDFFYKNKIDDFGIPVIGVVTSPLYFLTELLSIKNELLQSRKLISQFLLGLFLTKQRIKKLFTLPNLNPLIFESEGTRTRFIKDINIRTKTYVIRPSLPQSYITQIREFREQYQNTVENRDLFNVLYLGPPLNLRGIDTVVKAFRIFQKECVNSKLYLLSRTESNAMINHENRLRSLIYKEGLNNSVEVISGMLTQEDIMKHIASSNAVCLPFKITVSDVPLVTLEVLASGVPLITTDVAGVGEFASSKNCFIVPPNDPSSIASKLSFIHTNMHNKTPFEMPTADSDRSSSFEKVLESIMQ